MTSDLIERLEAATEGSQVTWCPKCGRIILSNPVKRHKSEVLSEGRDWGCKASMVSASPSDVAATLRARQSETPQGSES